ncbi:AAA family ATPase [Paraburkholderia hayleyella]|uniref:AAA family ATPase n=1 Tax=Paraburkholderia hayleyella TaxID=2152889 RepID=UPI001291462C|nr:AAA family ATPase [Paraburkholderia hayleyella]
MRAPLSFSLLGPLHLQRADTPLTLKYNKARSLLAWLILEPGFHTRDRLADLFWPAASTQSGRDRLKRMLSHLRGVLDDPLFDANRDTLRLNPQRPIHCDVREFLQRAAMGLHTVEGVTQPLSRMQLGALCHAASLYRGPFLHGLDVTDAPLLEHWIQTQRQSFACRAEEILRALARGHAQQGAWQEATIHARYLTTLTPCDESAWQLLIGILMNSGQHAEAQIALARCTEALANGLDLQPAAETCALVARRRVIPPAQAAQTAPPMAETPYLQRQLSVLCCDLQSGLLSDPEDLLTRLEPLRDQCAALLRRAGGYVCREPGGNLLAYFGFPGALEHAAQRAANVALDILRTVRPHPDIALRIGLHSAQVVSLAAEGVPDCAGIATRIASQLAVQAEAGCLVVSDAVRHLLEDAFICMPCNISATAVVGWRVYAVSGAYRAHARRCPLVGRTRALKTLNQARTRGRAVLLTGEAGIGKTRLISDYRAALRLPGIDVACEPDGTDSALHPFMRRLRTPGHHAGWHGEPAALAASHAPRALAVLEAQLAYAAQRAHIAQTPDRAPRPPATTTRITLKHEAHAIALRYLRWGIARAVPPGGLLWIDDLQWADPLTLALVSSLLNTPLPQRFIVLSARKPFRLPHCNLTRVTRQRLGPLAPAAREALIDYWAQDRRLDQTSRARILRTASGVPLFLEACTRDTLAHPAGPTDINPSRVPARLHDLLVTRLDATGDAKVIALCAAVIGMEFSVALLATISERSSSALAHALDVLIAHGIIEQRSATCYAFCHVLLREAAWHLQTRTTRETLQRRIDKARQASLQQQFPDDLTACGGECVELTLN